MRNILILISIPIAWTIFIVYLERTEIKPEICHTDTFYQEAFIEAYLSGDSFAFYGNGIEYEFIGKYE